MRKLGGRSLPSRLIGKPCLLPLLICPVHQDANLLCAGNVFKNELKVVINGPVDFLAYIRGRPSAGTAMTWKFAMISSKLLLLSTTLDPIRGSNNNDKALSLLLSFKMADDISIHLARTKMNTSDIFQTTFSVAFSSMKVLELRLKLHLNLFIRVQLTFRWWLGASQMPAHYLHQWWPSSMTHIWGFNEFMHGDKLLIWVWWQWRTMVTSIESSFGMEL